MNQGNKLTILVYLHRGMMQMGLMTHLTMEIFTVIWRTPALLSLTLVRLVLIMLVYMFIHALEPESGNQEGSFNGSLLVLQPEYMASYIKIMKHVPHIIFHQEAIFLNFTNISNICFALLVKQN